MMRNFEAEDFADSVRFISLRQFSDLKRIWLQRQ